jgi:hypothetical protein
MGQEGGAGVVCSLKTEGECVRSVWAKWGPWRGSGWSRRTVGRVRGFYWMSWSARIRGVRLQQLI